MRQDPLRLQTLKSLAILDTAPEVVYDDITRALAQAFQVPIAMVTTEKTGVDLQGGQIAIVDVPEGKRYITLIETAQAKIKTASRSKMTKNMAIR